MVLGLMGKMMVLWLMGKMMVLWLMETSMVPSSWMERLMVR
jgi:hypothetical protein